jgi:structural maintenance of chromosome 4
MLNVRALLLQLRLSKVSELIHNSTNHKDLDSASVMVHFVRIIDLVRQV